GLADSAGDDAVLPVRLPDAGMAALLRPGDVVDLLATDPGTGQAQVVATDVTVLAVPVDVPAGPVTGPDGALAVVGVRPDESLDLVGASLSQLPSACF